MRHAGKPKEQAPTSKLDTAIVTGLGAAALVLPLLVVPGFFNPLRVAKEVFLQLALVFFCAAFVQKFTVAPGLLPTGLKQLLTVPFGLPCVLALLPLVVHWARGTNDPSSALNLSLFLLAYVLAVLALPQSGEKVLIGASMLAGCMNSVAVILQSQQLLVFSSEYESYLGPPTERIYRTGLLGNPNELGFFLGCTAVLSFHVALRRFSGSWSSFALVTWTLSLIGLFLTSTLSAIIAFGVALLQSLILLALTFSKSERAYQTMNLHRRAMVLLLVPVIVGTGWFLMGTDVEERLERLQEGSEEFSLNRLLSDRYYPWLIGLDMAGERPVLGQGLGAYQRLYFDYKSRFLKENPDKLLPGLYYTYTHNEYIQLLSEFGTVGVLALVAFICEFFARGWRYVSQVSADPDYPLVLGFLAIGTATFVNALAHFTFHTAGTVFFLWSILTLYARRISA